MENINLRPSGVGNASDCLFRWGHTQLLGVKSRGSYNTLRGSSLHAGAESVLNNCIKAGQKDFNITEAKDKTEHEALKLCEESEYIFENFESKEGAVDEAVTGLDAWCDGILPSIEIPHSVETYSKAEIADGITIGGTADQIMQDGMIADIKTGARKTTANKHAIQLSIYQRLAQLEGFSINNTAQIQNVVFTKTGAINTHILTTELNYDYTKRILDNLVERIQLWRENKTPFHILFPPNHNSFLCSEKYCPIFNECYVKSNLDELF